MNRKIKIGLGILIGCVLLVLGYFFYQYIRVATAKIEVVLKDDLTAEFASDVKVSDYIEQINGTIKNNYKIDTTSLGKKTIRFQFLNEQKILVKYQYEIEVVDTVKPVIWLNSVYRVKKDSDIKLEEEILCGDNYDRYPKCAVEGTYDLTREGDYPLVFKAEDHSGNIEEKQFVLSVYEPSPSSSNNSEVETLDFSEVVANYKNKNNKIGIDISKWQKDVDFQKLKKAGVEFVMIRVGGSRGLDGEYFVDENFKKNMEAAKEADIPVGVYFYSYANSSKKARQDARWVLKQIKGYDIELPIAFDWEEWGSFNAYHLSFFGLTTMAEDFVQEVQKKGYQGMIYSSKNYLENIWLDTDYDIWLAHYTQQTDYKKDYKMWQLCSNGNVDGINGLVDIDILYP